ncbi:MAG: UvrD-helicase domain-containing protein [Rickettsiales bacterium]|jgi:ATP-dependent helicase/nuclease subunit A|nr:UvrD-helicase domain-containing protein [Rickettsiales bacterium]
MYYYGNREHSNLKNRRVVEDIGASSWVSASAGSGKTTVLMKRLLCLMLNGVEVSKIVCITYTKTGAQEIKERTYGSLSKLAIMADEEFIREVKNITGVQKPTAELLRRARNLFAKSIDHVDDLKIFTIHSFCQQLIGRFPLEARVSHNFKIIDEYQSSELVKESVDNLLQNTSCESEIHRYARLLILEKNEEDFYSFIKYLVSKRKKFEFLWKFDYRQNLKTILNLENTNEKQIIDSFRTHDCLDILTIFEKLSEFNPSSRHADSLNIIRNFIESADDAAREAYVNLFLTKEFGKRSLKMIFTKNFTELYGDASEVFTKEQERCYDFIQTMENVNCYNLTVAMVEFTSETIRSYGKIKQKKGLLDFDDLIITALGLLENTEYSAWIGYKLDGEIEHVLLDEAQDTSTLQWGIIENLISEFFSGCGASTGPKSIFIVGDEKQSIFSFQDANPKMFSRKCGLYKNLLEDSGNKFHVLDLQYSFRSVSTILRFVDEIFRDPDRARKIATLDGNIRHYSTREGVGLVELWPLVQGEKIIREAWKIDFSNREDVKKQEILAGLIVDKVAELVESERAIVTREGKSKKITYGDIMILVRSRNHVFLSYLIRNFNGRGIPNSGLDRLNIFEHIIIEDFVSLLTFILFPEDDLNLANLIKSPFIALTEDDLYELCDYRAKHGLSLFGALKSIQREKYILLEHIVTKSHSLGLSELCFYILEDCGFRSKILSRFSPDANDILNKFLLLVRQYESNSNPFLLDFLYFIGDKKNEIKKDLESGNIDQVRIMTVHASKGLQAPIVFIADANSIVDKNREKILWAENTAGYEIPIYAVGGHSDILENIEQNNREEFYAEYLRILYVALTRAENELYLCGLGNDMATGGGEVVGKTRNTWYELSRLALVNLGAREVDFGQGEPAKKYGKKLVYGEAMTYTREEPADAPIGNDEIAEVEEIVGNIKKYSCGPEPEKIVSPSQFYNDRDPGADHDGENISLLRGEALHRLLEILPAIDPSRWDSVSEIYLNNTFPTLVPAIRGETIKTARNILTDENFRQFFRGNSMAEVPIAGDVDGLRVFGKIDRLVELDDRVILLDYKSSSRKFDGADELPRKYVKQLELYGRLLEKLNPTKLIECYILATTQSKLIRVF